MSSRALRRLHGSNDLQVPRLPAANSSGDEDEEIPAEEVTSTRKVNLFNMLNMDDGEDGQPDDGEEGTSPPTPSVVGVGAKKKKKKQRKNKKAAANETDIDLDALIESMPDRLQSEAVTSPVSSSHLEVLQVQHKFLNPSNEMKRKFGQKVVNASENKRKDHKLYKKTTHMVTPANGWHPVTKSGFGMALQGQKGDAQVFVIEHKPEYQRIQQKFWEAVDSLNPENIMAVLQLHPYHIDSLLQLSEVCRMSEDLQMAAELIERTLYAIESNLHPLFSLASGKCRLDYQVWENRGFFLALYRHLRNIANRGCHRTALEYCKLLLRRQQQQESENWARLLWYAPMSSKAEILDPDNDPLCVLLMIDYYALSCEEYEYLINMYDLWNASRNLNSLPNFGYSVPLALFHTSEPGTSRRQRADSMLQDALSMFPGILGLIVDACGVDSDADENVQKYFGAHIQYGQPPSLKQLANLYAHRTFPCWKAPECMTWLEENVRVVSNSAQNKQKRYTELAEKGRNLYRGKAPLNIYRHLLTCEVKNATVDIPVEFTKVSVLSYDPLPPPNSIRSYLKPNRPSRQIDNQGFLSAFFNSLRPDFNIEAPVVEEDLDAAAGANGRIQQGVGNLMNAVRDLLNNIEMAPAPRDAGEQDEEEQDWDND